jgi:hypothetical protein
MASIGEGDYQVVKKRALCCSRSVCFFVLPRASKNLASRQKKKLEENSGPDPLARAMVTAMTRQSTLGGRWEGGA